MLQTKILQPSKQIYVKNEKNKIKNTQIIKIDLSPILCSLYSETLFCQLNIRLKYCLHICDIKMTKPPTLASEYWWYLYNSSRENLFIWSEWYLNSFQNLDAFIVT